MTDAGSPVPPPAPAGPPPSLLGTLTVTFPDACPGLLHPCVQVAVSNSANLNYIIRQLDVFTSSHWLREGPALGLARELP